MLVEGRTKMAPATTGPEAGNSSSLHVALRSDLGEKQPFKQEACLSAERGVPATTFALI